MKNESAKNSLSELTPEQLADVLQKSGSASVTPEAIEQMIREGAPLNDDGTIDFVKFTAYLVKRLSHGKHS